jgi:hypothetical protein
MSRQKLPVRATYRNMAHSPNHEYPFHFVGMIEDQKRYVITGLTNEQAQILYDELGKALSNNHNETDSSDG